MKLGQTLLLAIAVLLPVQVSALGLGEIELKSTLNQKLDAEIELVSVTADEVDSLTISMASFETFERYGITRPTALGGLRFDIAFRADGSAYVQVTSREVIKEPFLTFLIEANWARGRLLREYTVLLDPPTYTADEPVAEPSIVAQAPATSAEPVFDYADDTSVYEPDSTTSTGVVATGLESQQDVSSESPFDSYSSSTDDYTAGQLGGNYGPIQRNETLWGIASQLRPSDITMNQMMIAIFRANPEAFEGNINRMKQGYILRIPTADELRGVSRRDALAEAKQHNDEWRYGSTALAPSGLADVDTESDARLSLVAPSEDSDTGIGADTAEDIPQVDDALIGGLQDEIDSLRGQLVDSEFDNQQLRQRITELEEQLADSSRLIDVEDTGLAAFQDQVQEGDTAAIPEDTAALDELPELPALPDDAATGLEDDLAITPETDGDLLVDTEQTTTVEPLETDISQEPAVDDALDPGLDTPVVDTVAEPPVDEAQPVAEEPAPQEQAPVVTTPPPPPEPGIVDLLMDNILYIGGGLGVVVLGVVGAVVIRKRKAAATTAALSEEWAFDETEGDDDATEIATDGDDDAILPSEEETAMLHDRTGETMIAEDESEDEDATEAEKTMMMSAPPPVAPPPSGGDDQHVDTVVGGETVTLDDNDPISEADFHMAYGLYDQAAELVAKAAEREPDRRDLKSKLLEIHFAAGNNDAFVEVAQALRDQMGDAPDSDWDNVVIMGKQIAPENPLFAGGGSGGGSVDLDFEAAEGETALDHTFTEEDVSVPGAVTPQSDAAADDVLDFDVPGASEESASAGDAEPTMIDTPSGDLEFDIGDLGADTESAATGGEAAAGGEAAPEEEATVLDESAGLDLGMDLDTGGGAEATGGTGTGTGSKDTQTDFDKAIEELSAFVDTNEPGDGAGDQQDSELNLDDYSFDSQGDGAGGEAAGDDSNLGEAGTKLDLARAYIDMGDPDGAKNILEEVLQEGSDEQKQQAQDLISQIG